MLDIPVQSRRDTKAAERLSRKLLMKVEYSPRVLVTDEIGSYGVAHRKLTPR